MATQLEPQIKGLVLALDPRQVPTLHCLDGKNFLVNAPEVYSAFGSQFLTYERIEDLQDVTSFHLPEINDSRIFIPTGVLGYDPDSESYYPVMVFSKRASEVFPWSMAFVGGSYYFNKKGMPVIKYNPIIDEWLELDDTNSPGIAPNPYAITDSFGRLIIADKDVSQWSAIDDGQTFENPDLGAGAQSFALIGGGEPLAVFHTQTGYATYTTTGIMRSLAREADNPFAHRIGSEHITLLNPYAIAEIRRGIHAFLDISGLYQYNGEQGLPQEWQPLMSEFLRNGILRDYLLSGGAIPNIKFSFDDNTQLFSISFPSLSNPNFYNRAYVVYLPKDEWGSFDKLHVQMDDLFINSSFDIGFNPGFFDEKGVYHVFTGQPQVEIQDNPFQYVYFQTYFQIPVRTQNNVQTAAEKVDATTHDKSLYINTGLYDTDLSPVLRNYEPLDSFIDIGLMRLLDPEYADRYTMLSEVLLGIEGLSNFIVEDYNLVEPDVIEDWNTMEGEEDWGLNVIPNAGFNAKGIATLDGQTPLEGQEVDLTELEKTSKKIHYTCDINGIYHTVRLSAEEQNQQFRLRTAEPVLTPTGRT